MNRYNVKTCCEQLDKTIDTHCNQHPVDCPDEVIAYYPNNGGLFGIPHPDQNSFIQISFCPFCGEKIPEKS